MSLLTGALGRLLKTAESFVAGWLAVLVAQHAPFVSIGRDQILSGITFLVATAIHAAHAHGWDKVLVGRVRELGEPLQSILGHLVGNGDIVKELAAVVGKLDALIGLHGAPSPAAGGNALTGGGVPVAVRDSKPASRSSATR